MKKYEGVELSTILNFGTRRRSTVSFTPRETDRNAHCIGGWVGPTAGLDAVEKREISCLYRESSPDS
jgi:hypothetical protein